MPSLPFARPSVLLLIGVACSSPKPDEGTCPYFIPGPCEGPPHVILVTFKPGTTDAEIAAVNQSVDATVVFPGGNSEDIHVPGDECAALDKLHHDPHVAAAMAETYEYPLAPDLDAGNSADQCPPGAAPTDAQDASDAQE
jgi:hypothetical protein